MTSDGDGNNPKAVDPSNPDPESIEALLAELIGPEFSAPSESDDLDNGFAAVTDDRSGVHDAPEVQVAEGFIGSEDPTVAFPGVLPSVEDLAKGNADPAAETVATAEVRQFEIEQSELEQDETEQDETEPATTEPATTEHGHAGRVTVDAAKAETMVAANIAPAAVESGADVAKTVEAHPPGVSIAPPAAPPNVPISVSGDSSEVPGRPGKRPSTPTPVSSPVHRRRSGGRLAKLLLVALLGLFVLLLAAWGIDVARHQSTVMRGVTLDGESVSGLTDDELHEVLATEQNDLAETPVEVVVGDTTVVSDPMALGVSIDQDEMVANAMEIGRTGFFLTRPFTWLGRLFESFKLETAYQYDAETTAGAAQSIVAAELDQPKEPELVLDGNDQMVVEPGNSGTTISDRELVGRLPMVIEAGPPYRVDLQAEIASPEIDEAALGDVAADINRSTAEPVRIQVLDKHTDIEPVMLKSWTIVDTTEGDPTWTIDQERVLDDLQPRFPSLGSEDQKARFTVVDDEPIIVPASETVVCCDEDSVATIRAELAAPLPPPGDESDDDEDPDAPSRTITLEPTVVGFDEGVAELESLGIIEQVSTFTTEHSCCQNRVKNIQRFADLMQGVVIRPGEALSLNGHVGQRTIEKGFVADGAINLGVLEPQVGGGISQYATTFFNASFYAGLEFLEYQSHSLYISRYPRGREATISWRRPDLEVRNNTPYGILVWNEYTPTSITVSFYSTKHLDVVDLPLRRSSERQCRVDITPRVITYPDGSEVEDSVFAVYRPGEGLDCNGDSTRPEEDQAAPLTTSTTSAVLPDPDPDPEPDPDPDPEPDPTTSTTTTEP